MNTSYYRKRPHRKDIHKYLKQTRRSEGAAVDRGNEETTSEDDLISPHCPAFDESPEISPVDSISPLPTDTTSSFIQPTSVHHSLRSCSDEQMRVIAQIVISDLSGAAAEQAFELCKLNSSNSNIRLSFQEYKTIQSSIYHDIGLKRYILCSKCSQGLETMNAFCTNSQCSLYRENPSRHKKLNRTLYCRPSNYGLTLEMILGRHSQDIFEIHDFLHSNKGTAKRLDCRYFLHFRSMMEATREFRERHVVIQLLISVDGIRVPGHQKAESWLVSAKILDLKPSRRSKKINTILLAVLSGPNATDHAVLRKSLQPFLDFIKQSQSQPHQILLDGEQYSVTYKVSLGCADAAAIAKCWRTASANGHYGCNRCNLKGAYESRWRRVCWRRCRYVHRSVFECREEAKTGSMGIKGPSIFMDILPCNRLVVDFLHCSSEGLIKKILQDLFQSDGRRHALLSQEQIHCLQSSLAGIEMPTKSYSALRNLDQLNSMCGSEMFTLASIVLPIIVFLEFVDAQSGQFFLILIYFIQSLAVVELDSIKCHRLAKIARYLSSAMDAEFDGMFATFKKHMLLDHGADDLLYSCNPAELSSAQFEKDYRLYRRCLAFNNTRSVNSTMIERHHFKQSIAYEIYTRLDNSFEMKNVYDKLISKAFSPNPSMTITISENVSVQATDEVFASSDAAFNVLKSYGCSRFYKKARISKTYYKSREIYTPSQTQQHRVILRNGDEFAPGEIILFGLTQNNSLLSYISIMPYTCPISNIIDTLKSIKSYAAIPTLCNLQKENPFWFVIDDTQSRYYVVDCTNFLTPFVFVKVNDQTYALCVANNHNNPE